jgi:hypothetical protein
MIPAIPALLGVPLRGGRRLVSGPALPAFVALTRAQASARATALGADGTTWAEFAADSARLHGAARQLLIEGARTNRMRNPRAEGAAAGTPGTLPTNWALSGLPAGIASTVVGTVTVDGVQCLRLRVAGTPGSTTQARLEAEGVSTTPGANGQAWTVSKFLRIAAGTQAGLGLNLRMMGRDSGFSAYNTASVPLTPGTVLARYAAVSPFSNAAIVFATADMQLVFTAGQAVDCTLDIGWPQLEQGGFASTPVLPLAGAPAVSTRGTDLASASLAALGIGAGGACTILVWAVVPQPAPAGVEQTLVTLDNGTPDNRYRLFNAAGGSSVQVGRSTGGTSLNVAAGTMTAGTAFKAGIAINGAGRIAGSLNGGAVVAQAGGPTAGLTTLRLGDNAAGTASLFGLVRECHVLPYAVSDTALPGLVAALPG